MPQETNSRMAAGTIFPFSFIQSGNVGPNQGSPSSNELLALQCTGAGIEIVGISAVWTDQMMGTAGQLQNYPVNTPAAVVGERLQVWGDGTETMVMVGSGYTVQPDNLLVSDASGFAIPINLSASGVQWIGARAIEAGVAGDVIRVTTVLRPYYHG